MCGIAGYMAKDGQTPAPELLDTLAEAMAHRGPDGRGQYKAPGLGLVQTRLAIIDLNSGDQPLYTRDAHGRWLAIVANGEIYNYKELRTEIGPSNFSSLSDCETPLLLYRDEGLEFVRRLRGMYAIAIHDPTKNRLILARDPFGIKQLYYAETDEGFLFASEPQALIATGLVKPALRVQSRNELFQLQFTCGRETIFEGIHRLLPGELMVIEKGGISERRRQAALPDPKRLTMDEDQAVAAIDRVLRDSVVMHQRSDVPYGMFLSGGIDSSALLALMRDLNDTPVIAFTAGFSGTGVHDEREHAERVAHAAGADFDAIDFGEGDFWRLLPEIAAAMDDPVADYAILPSYKLAARARERSIKVVLSGEGGDELFGGYGRYRRARRPWFLGGRKMRTKGVFDGLDVLRETPGGWRDTIDQTERAARNAGLNRLQAAQVIDCNDWLPNDLLVKLDRCLMANGIEGRTPFLDPVVANVAFRLPDKLKIDHGLGKWALRCWLYEAMPEADPFARKRGFTVPVAEWISRRGAQLGPLIAHQPGIVDICDPDAVIKLFASAKDGRAGHAAWILLFYALWYRRHILGRKPEGDVFSIFSTLD